MAKAQNVPCVIIVRDGWGENPHPEHDAFNSVKLANTPIANMLDRQWPRTLIHTSGEDVGLPEETMGNSEVGHQNIGAGRIVDQDSVAITKAARAGLENNAVIANAIQRVRDGKGNLHLMGINSDAGVHGLLFHLYAILKACRTLNLSGTRVFIHLFSDGRDTGPRTGVGYVEQVEAQCRAIGIGRVASVIGRYYAMDRDNRWERVHEAYDCLTGRGVFATKDAPRAASAVEAFTQYYANPTTPSQNGDEFVRATLVAAPGEDPAATRVRDGDTVIFYNYRGDRPREIIRAFVFPEFEGHVTPSPDTQRKGFDRGPKLNLHFVTMAQYDTALDPFVHIAFVKPPKFINIAGEYLSTLGLTQFRCAETEKYPHVTFFFNDYREEPFPGESRVIIQSPRVATYDLKPEMSAAGVCDAVLARLAAPDCQDVIVVNFANGDMVGHTGSLPAAIRACEVVDECVGRIINATLARGGSLIVTADHGNAEQMFDPTTNAPHTSHTLYDVPLYVVGEQFKGRHLRSGGRLADVVPTALAMMGLDKPAEMSGESLLTF